MVELALNTGMRVGEIQALRWSDVELDQRRICINHTWTSKGIGLTKGGGSRVIPINLNTVKLLEDHRSSLWTDSEYVFRIGEKAPVTRNQLRSPMDRAVEKAGLGGRRIGWHALRHTYAANLASSGKYSLRIIQALLGHASIVTTERYAHLLPSSFEQARKDLEDLFTHS